MRLITERQDFGVTDLKQRLFRVEKRTGFLKLVETLLRQSGGRMEAVNLAKVSGLSRPTVLTYLEVFELTHVMRVLRPYHGGGKQELAGLF